MMVRTILSVILIMGTIHGASASVRSDADTSSVPPTMTFADFFAVVMQRHLPLLAARHEIDIASARTILARAIPDIDLTVAGFDNNDRRFQTGYGFSVQLATTIELGGKRTARMNLAQSEEAYVRASITDYIRNLRTEAALAFVDAARWYQLLDVRTATWHSMRSIADADSIRAVLGSLSNLDATQSRLEAETMLLDVIGAQAEWKQARRRLDVYTGRVDNDTTRLPVIRADSTIRDYTLPDLIDQALASRSDLLASKTAETVARRARDLAQANGMIDLSVSLGNTFVSVISNVIEPTPSYNSIGIGVGIPLRLSDKATADIGIADLALRQTQLATGQTSIRIMTDVEQAFAAYEGAVKQLRRYRGSLLGDAGAILQGKTYSYQRGQTSLLEVLNAQRTYSELRERYVGTLYDVVTAMIRLQHSVGTWDGRF